jgi:hypothetical protein
MVSIGRLGFDSSLELIYGTFKKSLVKSGFDDFPSRK